MSSSDSATPGATWLQKRLTLVAIAILKHFRPHSSSVLFLTKHYCVKFGPFVHMSTAATIQFVKSNTSIPVPDVKCAFHHKDYGYIVMSRIAGQPISYGWFQRPAAVQERLSSQLRTYITELRALQPRRPGAVEGVNRSQLYDGRLDSGYKGFGPFDSVEAFHLFLRGGNSIFPKHFPEINELVKLHSDIPQGTTFTHCDLNSGNILIDGDNVVGIVDWDYAGWYPKYWQWSTARSGIDDVWKEEVRNFLEPYPEAERMEKIREKYFGAF